MLKIKKSAIFIYSIFAISFGFINQAHANIKSINKSKNEQVENIKPKWLTVLKSEFLDAEQDDLVTAGIGFSKLLLSKQPLKFADDIHPTASELRFAKLNRFISAKAGESALFGVDRRKLTPVFDGKIAGYEVLAKMNQGNESVALLLHVPLDFNTQSPCIVAVPTMDLEGVYNAKDIQIRGLFGLKKNCAVVYNDKGLGLALFDFDASNGYQIDGEVSNPFKNDDSQIFEPKKIKQLGNNAHRYVLKSLHSGINHEANWGQYVLNSIEFAFYELNELFAPKNKIIINKDNTKVFVYGASDGAVAALKAGEQDTNKLIDGIVAVNPPVQVKMNKNIDIYIDQKNNKTKLKPKTMADYTTYSALYMPCAIAAIREEHSIYTIPNADNYRLADNRCKALKEAKLLTSKNDNDLAKEALNKLYEYGLTTEMIAQLPYFYTNHSINLPYRYVSQYGRYEFNDQLCGYSASSVDQELLYNEGEVKPLTKTNFAQLWVNFNGSLPIRMNDNTIVIDLVNDDDPKGSHREYFSRSKGVRIIDYNLKGAICLRNQLKQNRVKSGESQVLATGKINQIKTIVVHGQQNILAVPNNTARAYAALNSYLEGSFSNLKYIEIENASYLDGVVPFDNILIPIDYYGEQAMQLLWDSVIKKANLPDSQVIRTKVRGGKIGFAPSINRENLPDIKITADTADKIILNDGTIKLPN